MSSMIPTIQESQESQESQEEKEWAGFELPTLTDGFETTDDGFRSKKNDSYEVREREIVMRPYK